MKIRNNVLIAIAGVLCLISFFAVNAFQKNQGEITLKEVRPFLSDIRQTVSTSGTVLPKNRLELGSSVSGRIEKVLVTEGDSVVVGQILALMSSSDRAALIDAARLQGEDVVKYWEKAYKEIPVVSPISGTVIVRSVEPGQTVTASDIILVISDRLIVKAQFDETDIGKINTGQKASITLDAHPEINIKSEVSRIYYESQTVNNVTVYNVVVTPQRVPSKFRSGMSASIDVVYNEKKNILLVSQDAILSEGNKSYVLVKSHENKKIEKREVSVGLSNDTDVEIISGIGLDDVLLVKDETIELGAVSSSKNPLIQEQSQEKRPPRQGPPPGSGGK